MKLEVNGVEYDHFTQVTAEIRLDALSNTFSFVSVGIGDSRPAFKIGDICRVIVNDETVITGHIEIIDGDYDSGSHNITYSGRDKTGDLVDSSLSAISDLTGNITLKTIIERILTDINLDIEVIDKISPDPFNDAEDIIAPESGDNAFDFIEKLARKRQVILTSNSDGDIVIEDTPGPNLIHAIQNILGADNNNVLSASFSYDHTGRYNVYKMNSGLNPLSLTGSVSSTNIVNQKGSTVDNDIRLSRQLVLISEGSYSNSQNISRAEWESRIRRARGQLYSATLQGHTTPDGSELWRVNTIIGVLDDFAGLSAEMLINSIVYNLSLGSGSTTTLSLVEQNAYNLELEEPQNDTIGNGFA